MIQDSLFFYFSLKTKLLKAYRPRIQGKHRSVEPTLAILGRSLLVLQEKIQALVANGTTHNTPQGSDFTSCSVVRYKKVEAASNLLLQHTWAR